MVQPPEQHEVGPAAQHLVDRSVLPDQPDPPPHPGRIARDVDAVDGSASAVGTQQGREDPDRGRLARAVRPEQPADGAGGHREIDAGQRLGFPEALPEVRPLQLRTPYGDSTVHDTEMTEYGGSGDPERSLELLWRVRQPSSRGPKPKLDLDQIVSVAIELADEEGLAPLSMRKVAERLGVGTMSLYTYVPGKAELIDLMIDATASRVVSPG